MSSSPPLVVADRYRLVAPLGQGGMGRVWRATDVVLHREVAIKELVPPPGLTAGERQEMRERSLREARAIARLNNINVVRVFDVLRTDADPWIVMEYVPSRSLQDTLAADGPYSPVRAAEIGLGVLNALRAAHRAGVVHRDVKPGNVLIGADGRVVLTDFGLATVPGDPNVTRTGLVLGSPAYIAPERARDGSAGPAADLWSLGATLYAAVEGASPFARPSAIATLAALATENPPPARNAGPMKPVLNGLLRKDPTHRINAEEAERLLLRAAGRRSKLSFPMSPTMRRPGVGRDRAALTGGTASTPVVPGPRPPVARPANPPGRTPVTPAQGRAASPPQPPVNPGRPGADQGRPVFAPGKAPVSRPAAETPTRVDTPKVDAPRLDATRVDGPKIDATRVDGPPVRDDKTTFIGTGPHTPEPPRSGPHASGGISRTSRSAQSGFTAADVAANRRKTAAPEHERSLADATALIPRAEPDAPAEQTPVPAQSDPTTKIQTPPKSTTAPAKPKRNTPEPADKTTRIPAPVDQTTKIAGPAARPADPTTKISEPVDRTTKITEPAKKPEPAKTKAEDATLAGAKPAGAKPKGTQPAGAKGDVKDGEPAKGKTDKPAVVDATQVVSPAKSAPAKGKKTAVPAKRNAPAAAEPNSEGETPPATEQNTASETAAKSAAQSTTEDSAAQGSSAQSGTDQGSSAQSSSTQSGTEQGGSAQSGEQGGTGQGSPEQSGIEQGSLEQGSPEQGDTDRGGTAQGSAQQGGTPLGGVAQAGTEQGGVAQGSTAQDSTAQAGTEQGAVAQSDVEQGSTAHGSDAQSSAAQNSAAEAAAKSGTQAATAEDRAAESNAAQSDAAQSNTTESDLAQASAADDSAAVSTAEAAAKKGSPSSAAQTSAATTTAKSDPPATSAKSDSPDAKAKATEAQAKDVPTAPAAPQDRTRAELPANARRKHTPVDDAEPLSPAPAFNRSSRPAWAPMPVRQSPGVTVFGTRLTYGQAAFAGGVLLLIIVLVVVLIGVLGSDGDGDDNQSQQPPVVPTVSAGGASQQPAAGAPSNAPSTPKSTAPSSPAGLTLPSTWRVYSDGSGFKVPLPKSASISQSGSETRIRWNNRLLLIDQTDEPKPDALADWKQQERDRAGRDYRDYQKVKLVPVSNYFKQAADWEFFYTTSSGNPQHAVKRNIIVSDSQAYSISWYVSPDDWDASQADLKLVYQGFQPKK